MEDIFLYTSLSIFLCLLVTFELFRQSKRRRYPNLPPSPSLSLPILGHLYLLKTPIHRTFHRLSQKHGPVFSLWFGSRRVVIVASSSAVQECFTKNDITLANRPPSLLYKYLGYNHTSIAASPYGDHWQRFGGTQAYAVWIGKKGLPWSKLGSTRGELDLGFADSKLRVGEGK